MHIHMFLELHVFQEKIVPGVIVAICNLFFRVEYRHWFGSPAITFWGDACLGQVRLYKA